MRTAATVLIVLVGLVNALPVAGVLSRERLETLYGVALPDPNLVILMRHRAALFGVVGALLLVSAFQPALRAVAYAAGFFSMLSFVAIAWLEGGYSTQLRRVVLVDLVASGALLAALAVDRAP